MNENDPKHPLRSWTIRFFGGALPLLGAVVGFLGDKANAAVVQVLLTPKHFAMFTLGVGIVGCLLRARTTKPISLPGGDR